MKTPIDHAKPICSTQEALWSEIQLLKWNLLRTGYPENIITKAIEDPKLQEQQQRPKRLQYQ